MNGFIDLFEQQVIDGDLSLDQFLDQLARITGDLLEYSDPDLFEARLHRFSANMYLGRNDQRESCEPIQGRQNA